VLRAVQFRDAFDDDPAGARAFDFGAHGVEEIREIDDLRLGGGAFDDGGALGEDGGHHDIVGSQDGRAEFPPEIADSPLEPGGEDLDIAALDAIAGAQRLKTFQVQIDGPVANDASPGEGDGGFLFAAKEGAEDAHGSAHLADDFIRGVGGDFLGLDGDGAAGPFDLRAEVIEDLQQVMHVAQVGDVMDDALIPGEQSGREDRQRGVLRPADLDRTGKLRAAVDENFIHLKWKIRILCAHGKEKSFRSLVILFALDVLIAAGLKFGNEPFGLIVADLEGEKAAGVQA